MLANSLAAAAGARARSGREAAADGTIAILATRSNPLFWPCRELNEQHTPESFRRRSRLGEKYLPRRKREHRHSAVISPRLSFRPVMRVALASEAARFKLFKTGIRNRCAGQPTLFGPYHRLEIHWGAFDEYFRKNHGRDLRPL